MCFVEHAYELYEALGEDESGRSVGGGGQIATMKQLPLTSCATVLLVFLQMNGFYVPCVMMPFRLFTCPPFPHLFSVVVGGDGGGGGGGGRGSVGAVYALCLVTEKAGASLKRYVKLPSQGLLHCLVCGNPVAHQRPFLWTAVLAGGALLKAQQATT